MVFQAKVFRHIDISLIPFAILMDLYIAKPVPTFFFIKIDGWRAVKPDAKRSIPGMHIRNAIGQWKPPHRFFTVSYHRHVVNASEILYTHRFRNSALCVVVRA